jgi:thioredoxin-related protein
MTWFSGCFGGIDVKVPLKEKPAHIIRLPNLFAYRYFVPFITSMRFMITSKIRWFLTVCTFCVFTVTVITAQTAVKWLSWDEAIAMSRQEPRKFFVDVYTDWCGWCKKMDKATFENTSVATYLNSHYYPIKFNAEQRSEIKIHDKVYQYVSGGMRGGYHQWAAEITYGRLSYPTLVFLDENMKVIQPLAGFKEADELQKIMQYFAEDHHKTTPWNKYCPNPPVPPATPAADPQKRGN